jgi:Icc-related predicted phosphoesterase
VHARNAGKAVLSLWKRFSKPRVYVFGHIHAGCGKVRPPRTLFVDAPLLGEEGSLGKEPVVIDVESC